MTNALLQDTFHVPDLFIHLISFGVLLEKRYSFDTRRFYVLDISNRKVAYAPLQDNLFPVKVAYKRAKQSKSEKLPEKSDLFAPQGGAPTSCQGVLKLAMLVARSSHNYWHQIWKNVCAPFGAYYIIDFFYLCAPWIVWCADFTDCPCRTIYLQRSARGCVRILETST